MKEDSHAPFTAVVSKCGYILYSSAKAGNFPKNRLDLRPPKSDYQGVGSQALGYFYSSPGDSSAAKVENHCFMEHLVITFHLRTLPEDPIPQMAGGETLIHSLPLIKGQGQALLTGWNSSASHVFMYIKIT